MWGTWANLLTGIRLLAIAPAAWSVIAGQWRVAAILFAVAVVTDLSDGPIARRFGQASPMGGLFDHATDALFVSVMLGALAWVDLINPWLSGLVMVAFIQYMFDSRALAGAHLRTSQLGRYNGIAYFVMVGIPVTRNALGWDWPPGAWISALGWLLAATTLVSMIDRARALISTKN